MVRPGVALYGANPTPGQDNPMRPVVSLQGNIALVRNVPRGASVGYGATFIAERPSRIAIVTVGYADGYPRSATGAEAMIAGRRCPVAGRISMDMLALDVTELPENVVRRGDAATLLGEGISVDDLAHWSGTIGYEVLTRLGSRYARVYRG
jgi:alanine racemase